MQNTATTILKRMGPLGAVALWLILDFKRVEDIVPIVYGELDDDTAELAAGNVLAHLIKLRSDGKVKGQKNFTAV